MSLANHAQTTGKRNLRNLWILNLSFLLEFSA